MGIHILNLPTSYKVLILVLIILVYVGVRVISYLTTRKKPYTELDPGTPRHYGLAGGAICPRCHRPFRLDFMAIKLGIGYKYARCEFCGKWSLVKRLGTDELRSAEQAELVGTGLNQQATTKSESEKLNDLLDKSRFTE